MQRQPATTIYALTHKMSKKEIENRITAAKNHINRISPSCSAVKLQLLDLTVAYAEECLCSLFSRKKNRYVIYSNIINFANRFSDEIHFFAYVVQQLEQIPVDDDSTFRKKALPFAKKSLHLLLTPEISKTRKAFAGLAAFGLTTMMIEPRTAVLLLSSGLAGFAFSEHVVYQRLQASLQNKMHHYLIGNAADSLTLTDGFEDVVGTCMNTATSMLESSATLFFHTGEKFRQYVKQMTESATPRIEPITTNAERPDRVDRPFAMNLTSTQNSTYANHAPLFFEHHLIQSTNPLLLASAPIIDDEEIKAFTQQNCQLGQSH